MSQRRLLSRRPLRPSALLPLLVVSVATSSLAAAPDRAVSTPWKTIAIATPAPPPEWALWQRQLLAQLYPAALELVEKYTRPDGTLIWRDEWPGMDGSDDGYESFYNFPLYYALGGPAEMDALARKLWDAVTKQFTRYGQIHEEFDGYYDWMHHGESYTYFYFFGLANPADEKMRQRAVRFAGLYLGEDPKAPNYDPAHKMIRSPLTGSRGPRFDNTVEDWVTHRPILAGYPLPYDDIPQVTSSDAWNDDSKFPFILEAINRRMMRCDVPLNLTSTSMILNAFMYTGDPKYRQWVCDYVGAWIERVKQNDGILPDNVGPSGKVGETIDGKWWGGYYGWRWPHGLFNQLESTFIGAGNAYLITGDASYLELPRSVLTLVESKARQEGTQTLVPHRHGENGWYDYRPLKPKFPIQLWYLSRDPQDWRRVERLVEPAALKRLSYHKGKGDSENSAAWLGYLAGANPEYPVEILKATYAETLHRLEKVRADDTTPDEQDVHHWQRLNPVVLEGLVQTMLGAPNHVYHGGLLHCSLRYFDPQAGRPGVPPDVAALVERITPEGITLQLVNLHPTEARDVILQAGAFGEHEFVDVRQVIHYPHQFHTVGQKLLQVHLEPAAVGKLEIGIKRFVNAPTYAPPWSDKEK